MMEPLPDHIERLRLDPAEIDPVRAAVLVDIVARVRARLASGERRPVAYAPRPLPPVRPQQPPRTIQELAAMVHPAVLLSQPEPAPPREPLVEIDMSLPMAQRARQALAQGKRNIKQMMEITGASKYTCFVERAQWLRRTGEKLPPPDSINKRIRGCIAAGMTDAREIQQMSGATRRNHIHQLLKEAREKGAQ